MAAIAHGWKPSGAAADIPVSVAKDFNAADTGKKRSKLPQRVKRSGAISEKAAAKHGI